MTGLPIVEVFGPTLQGEGPYAGRNAHFIRLGGCNLSCVWCDTPYSWDATRFDLREEIKSKSVTDILRMIDAGPPGIVVITGGEPLLHQNRPDFGDLLIELKSRARQIHVETNGTIEPSAVSRDLVDVFIVSPKLASSGEHGGRSPAPSSRWHHVTRAEVHLKIVCEDAADVAHAVSVSEEMRIPLERLWVMPLASTKSELDLRWPEIARAAADAGVNASSRLHILAWGDERAH